MLSALLVVWGVATTALVGLLIYRALLSMKEDDQLFLGEGERHLAAEQAAIVGKVQAISRYSLIMGIVSGALLLAIAGMWTYQQLMHPPA
ncbi:MAG TPA: hypothetical protein VKV74_01785 [Bryobacteraceae bacterium]|nr:hypothetical protein [Bryobacteraceae bacterium]